MQKIYLFLSGLVCLVGTKVWAANTWGSLGAGPEAAPNLTAGGAGGNPGFPAAGPGMMPQGAPMMGMPPQAGGATTGAAGFQGFNLGPSFGIEHMSLKIDDRSYSGTGTDGGLSFGYGTALTDNVYFGGEMGVRYGASTLTYQKTAYKVKSTYSGDIAAILGFVAPGHMFMPYIRFGGGLHAYEYITSTEKNKFNVAFLNPGIGVQGLVTPNFLMRLEASYSMPLGAGKLKQGKLNQKPKRAILQMAGLYKF